MSLWVFGDTIGLGLGILIYLGVIIALAVPIFIAAASVSRRF
jgi:small basic protein